MAKRRAGRFPLSRLQNRKLHASLLARSPIHAPLPAACPASALSQGSLLRPFQLPTQKTSGRCHSHSPASFATTPAFANAPRCQTLAPALPALQQTHDSLATTAAPVQQHLRHPITMICCALYCGWLLLQTPLRCSTLLLRRNPPNHSTSTGSSAFLLLLPRVASPPQFVLRITSAPTSRPLTPNKVQPLSSTTNSAAASY